MHDNVVFIFGWRIEVGIYSNITKVITNIKTYFGPLEWDICDIKNIYKKKLGLLKNYLISELSFLMKSFILSKPHKRKTHDVEACDEMTT